MIYDGPEKGHRSIWPSCAHIFALPARLRTLRHFANFLSHKGEASRFIFYRSHQYTDFWRACFFGKRQLLGSKSVQSIIYHNSISQNQRKKTTKKAVKSLREKLCNRIFLRYLHLRTHAAFLLIRLCRSYI